MFGLGMVEIGILVALVVLVFGGAKARELFSTAFKTYQKVNQTKQELRNMVSLDGLLGKKDKDS
ncbi:hypothetical protein DESUT3_10420 [Desulfuromonas versatilis]|uniref:Uncharacterized protein n=1 Tax=Desulfuromonas versatilis TaxID=2802975 RepID=A0ABN6DV44_9BACT|nr:hypothetical protein [Desulfuromonas versatilis]BCR03973.1 hypothetical protein DESUT3_10420 [Desulfuromonas versatilis]